MSERESVCVVCTVCLWEISFCRAKTELIKRQNEAYYTVRLVSNWNEVKAKSPDAHNRFSPDSESKVSYCCHCMPLKNLANYICPAEQTDCDSGLHIFVAGRHPMWQSWPIELSTQLSKLCSVMSVPLCLTTAALALFSTPSLSFLPTLFYCTSCMQMYFFL